MVGVPIKSIENLCFEGGGIRGMAYVGVAKALDELGLLPQIKRYIGSSAGAIFAAGGACKIPYDVMKKIVDETDFTKFKDSGWVGQGYNTVRYWGLHSGEYFTQWCRNIFQTLINDPGTIGTRARGPEGSAGPLTFAQVHAKFGTELVITATDLTKGKTVYMSKETTPDLEICDAIRRSMSIPIFYAPVIVRESDGIDHVYVDGGCTNNFPLTFFDAEQLCNSKTLGFFLSTPPEVTNQIRDIADIVTSLISVSLNEVQELQLQNDDQSRIVNIPTFGIPSTKFDLTKDELARLQESGYSATMNFFRPVSASALRALGP